MTKISDALRQMEGGEPERQPRPAQAGDRAARGTGLLAPTRRGHVPQDSPLSLAVERDLVSLRTTVESLLPGQSSRTIALAGIRGGEGVTTVASGFAHLVHADPTQTLALIDANVLRPRLAALYGAEPSPGFADVLTGSSTPASAVCAADARTHVVPAGHGDVRHLRPDTASVDRMLASFGGYSYVLIDCAPIVAWPQSAACAAAADGVILVVEWGRTKREVVQRAMDLLDEARARILGVVMNRRRYPIPDAIYRRV